MFISKVGEKLIEMMRGRHEKEIERDGGYRSTEADGNDEKAA
jgi:hypothetical protein